MKQDKNRWRMEPTTQLRVNDHLQCSFCNHCTHLNPALVGVPFLSGEVFIHRRIRWGKADVMVVF